MDFLVTMTTHVPEGTPQEEVDDVRAREAANSRRLAELGRLERLWRPPLQPGEWRSLGLFSAPDPERLEEILSSMPLRVWRTDEVTPLTPHPNDPGPGVVESSGDATEYLVTFTVAAPDGSQAHAYEEATAGEAVRTKALAREGRLVRLWRTPGEGRALGLFRAHAPAEMKDSLDSLPLAPWLTTVTTPLSEHPNDPARRTS
jgi:muconolactone delta-isomerase